MEISIKWNICRICLQEESRKEKDSSGGEGCQMLHIHNDTKLSKQIYECSGVLVDPEDSLPDKICKKCMTVLRYAVNFRNTCRNSDEYLQSVLKKAKSATSLFKLEKKRQETLHMVNYVIEEIEDHELESYASDEDHNNEKRKRTPTNSSKEELQVTKKSKVVKNLLTKEVEEKFLSLKNQACEELTASDEAPLEQTEINTVASVELSQSADESTGKLLLDLVGEEAKQESTANEAENNVAEEKEIEHSNPLYNTALEIKTESAVQDESECSSNEEEIGLFEETLSDDQDDENEADFATTQEESTTTITTELCASKETLQEKTTQQISNHERDCILPIVDGEREFFYLLSASEGHHIKTECIEDDEDLNATDQEFIEMDEETKLQCDNANIGDEPEDVEEENIEYLIDSADENSLTALEYKGDQSAHTHAEQAIKSERLKHRGTGEIRVYVCDVCGNHFTNRNLLNFHMKIHRNEKNFECELCYKRFNAACNLSAHMRIHTGEKPYECQYCGRRFADRSTQVKHERIHTNEKPFTCETCGKAFSLSTSLRAHEKIHTGEKPYRCQPCSKSFKLPHQLKAHLKTHLHKLISVEQ